jgi:glucose/arabinose dehydrogenase
VKYVVLLGLLAACGDNFDDTAVPEPATRHVMLQVPAGMNAAPLDQKRIMLLPPGFGIRVIARVPTARFLAETPEGDILVSHPGELENADGEIYKITNPHGSASVSVIASGLTLSHDMVFATRGGTTYLYISEHDRITRTAWDGAAATLGPLEEIVSGLPSVSLPELHGAYGHGLKNIAISGDTLYVSIASATNSDPSDQLADPVRGSIYVYPVDGGGSGRLYAKGIRNAEGLALHPLTGDLWIAVNHRDNLRYPLMDGTYPYGALAQDYVNDHPVEPFTRVRDGGNYGWPYCNPTPERGFSDMPYVQDIDNNAGETVMNCESIDVIDKGLPAHSAPLGMSFWTGELAPVGYRNGAVMGLHGCWNCSVVHGYKAVFMAMQPDGSFADAIDLVAGFWPDPQDGDPMEADLAWGRPVDVIPNRDGNLYISDDRAGAVYELYRL